MRSAFKIIGLVIAVSIAGGSLFWLSPWQETKKPLRIGVNAWPGYAYLYLAQAKGFLKAEGVQLDILSFSSLSDIRHAYERGQLDGMACTITEMLQAQKHGRTSKVVLLADFSNGADKVIATRDITSIQDLKGKRIAIEPATLGAFILARVLEEAGINQKEVRVVGMDQLEMKGAILNGMVDAVISYPPTSSEILHEKERVHTVFDSSQIPGEIVDIFVFDPKIVAERGNELLGMQKAWDESLDYASKHPEEANAIMAAREGLTPAEFKASLAGIQMVSTAEMEKLLKPQGPFDKAVIIAEGVLDKTEGRYDENPVSPSTFLWKEGGMAYVPE